MLHSGTAICRQNGGGSTHALLAPEAMGFHSRCHSGYKIGGVMRIRDFAIFLPRGLPSCPARVLSHTEKQGPEMAKA
eukprot:g13094.t1